MTEGGGRNIGGSLYTRTYTALEQLGYTSDSGSVPQRPFGSWVERMHHSRFSTCKRWLEISVKTLSLTVDLLAYALRFGSDLDVLSFFDATGVHGA